MGSGSSKIENNNETAAGIESANLSTSSSSSPNNETRPSEVEESKCPMHNADGSYSYDWRHMFKAAAVHGPKGTKPLSEKEQERAKNRSMEASSGCPVKHNPRIVQEQATSGCPVRHDTQVEYNVYSQPIDKTNQMPKGVKTQMPTATQKAEISVDRVKSTIPKGGAESGSTWTYPSPQQFYNALARKGKLGGDTSEEDMESVVALHNNMNEKTWAQVVEWEKKTYKDSPTPKLLKFQGRPHDLSPKAALKHYLLGHPLPYDRHDWTVLRDDGTTIRYIIDYYYDETRARETADSAKPSLHDRNATPSLLIDVRPALDGPVQLFARAVQMPYKLASSQTTFQPLPLKGNSALESQVQESVKVWESIQQSRRQELATEADTEEAMTISADEAKEIATNFAKVLKSCRSQQTRVDRCQSEEECSKASVDLTMCMGPSLCPVQHKALLKAIADDDDAKIETALETISECVVFQTGKRALAKQQHPVYF